LETKTPSTEPDAPDAQNTPDAQNIGRWLLWLPPVALLAVVLAFDPRYDQPDVSSSYPIAHGLVALIAYALISLLLDLAWSIFVNSLPIYKRHLAIFGLLALPIVVSEWYLTQHTSSSANIWQMSGIGIILGLILSCLPFVYGSRNPTYGWRRGSNERHDTSRRLVVVADPHWGEEFAGLWETTRAMPDADWLFLGDVFDVWVGLKGFETDVQKNFIWWVSERRRVGCWVGLWLGNREYFLDGLADKFDFMGEGIDGKLQGEPFVFEHGDLINPEDRQYRFWNLISRSGPLWLFAKIIPAFIGKRIVIFLEKKLQTTNMENKAKFPREEFQKAVDKSGADFFITGHFHTFEEVEKGVSIPWAHDGKFVLWQNGEFKLLDGH